MRQRPIFTVTLAALLAAVLFAACAPQGSGSTAGTGETFAGLPRVTPESAGMSSERLDRIRPAFESYVTDGKLSGVVTAVARDGKVVHFEASGYQDVEAGEPMAEDTIFRMYSMTKPIASAALMILWEEGHFLLSTPLSRVLPEFADTQVYVSGDGDDLETEPARRPIVIRDLMTHTSGLTYTFIPSPVAASYVAAGLEGSADAVPHDDLAHYVRELAKQPLLAHPGTAWNYSVGLEVAGRVVEVVSGQSFRDFLKERIFDPLGMVDTYFYLPESKVGRYAALYRPGEDGKIVLTEAPDVNARHVREPHRYFSGSGGLVSTAADYYRFHQMMLNGGELDGARILGRKTVELMTSNHTGDHGLWLRGPGYGFGLGYSVVTDKGASAMPASVGSYSWGGAYCTVFWVDPVEELIGILMTQVRPYTHLNIRQDLQTLTYQAIVD